MFSQVILKPLFELFHPLANLFIQLWIAFMLTYVLLLKDCLYIFLWTGLKLKKLISWILKTLCMNNSFVWASFLKEVQKDFSEPIFPEFVPIFPYQQCAEDFESLIRTPGCQAQSNEQSPERKNSEQYMCQNCQSKVLLHYENLKRTSLDGNSPKCEVLKHSVGTQTIIEREIANTGYSHFETPTHSSMSQFGKGEWDSTESLNSVLKSYSVKKQISLNCKLPPVRYPSSSCESKNDVRSRSLSPEFEKIESLSMNRTESRRASPEEFVDIPLESPENVSQLLESPLCQFNLESMRNLRLQFSRDVCIPRLLSPEEKSSFKKSWNKLKLMGKVNKRFLEMKNMKLGNTGNSTMSPQRFDEIGRTDILHQIEIKNLTTEDDNSEMTGCCSYMFHRLKSKFGQKVDAGSVVYKKF